MGQDESSPIDESMPAATLKSRTLDGVAEYIRSGRARRIVIMAGAGISTSAGVPDFRSPDTGLYANLARLDLPFAEAVFDISYFRENPRPFYTLAKELYPGTFRPTLTHCFFRLLHEKGRLLKLFTQNIDCLERAAGVPDEAIIEAHGSFAHASCIDCRAAFPDEAMRAAVDAGSIPRCERCRGLVKPDIVFFGEALPASFHANRSVPEQADLAIVLGTSLTVQPFASLPGFCREGTPRLLINKERVGGLGSRPDDVLLLGDCDAGVRRLAAACGWEADLDRLWKEINPAAAAVKEEQEEDLQSKTADDRLADEVDKLSREIDDTLAVSRRHEELVRREADGKSSPSHTRSAGGGDTADDPAAEGLLAHVFPHMKKGSSL
ncbi:hypothetical protein ANO11243_013050 [Dothideomycetidae sp. 11243]|nr:hypothetical protein ANO11243_013050 [fungal sp. No.11243]